ncbi:MAG: hypothetical protein IPH82_30080 [Chloroflexi bacterium]|nr:hypothetical protein [Chloroflexota bacterium]
MPSATPATTPATTQGHCAQQHDYASLPRFGHRNGPRQRLAGGPNTALLLNPDGGLTWGMEARFSDSSGTFAYNLTNMDIWLDRDGAQGSSVGNVTNAQSNWFVDMAAANLHLAAGVTAVIDQAAPLAAVPDDYDGFPRPYGPAPDIGAMNTSRPLYPAISSIYPAHRYTSTSSPR